MAATVERGITAVKRATCAARRKIGRGFACLDRKKQKYYCFPLLRTSFGGMWATKITTACLQRFRAAASWGCKVLFFSKEKSPHWCCYGQCTIWDVAGNVALRGGESLLLLYLQRWLSTLGLVQARANQP
jgi:hypothetical protein